jgi:hypothetical protein
MAPVPEYDLSMDELGIALSYVSSAVITTSTVQTSSASKAKAPAPAVAKKEDKKPKKVRMSVPTTKLKHPIHTTQPSKLTY